MLDPSTDFADITDGTEAVTLLRRGTDSGDLGTSIAHALRCAITTGEAIVNNRNDAQKKMQSDGLYAASDIVWHLPIAEVPDSPRLGDVILDAADQRWTILQVKRATFGSRWRCPARNLVVTHGLDDAVTVLKATYSKSTCGAAEPTWLTWKTGIRARIQPAETTLATNDQSQQAVSQYNIFVAEDLTLDQTHRILGPDGTVYRITASLGNQRIGELQTIKAEVVR